MKILAMDLGTSSARALVLDENAAELPGHLARRKVTMATEPAGAGTLDAAAYLAALVACVDELADAGRLDGVGLVAVSAQWHSLLPVDTIGAPLGPVLTWLDSRAAAPSGVSGPADPADYHRRTGTWWHRCYWPMRLRWLRDCEGVRAARYVGLAEYVLGELLDDPAMSISQASGTGLLDLRAGTWDEEALELAGVPATQLPALAAADWRGRLRPEYARRWPPLAGAAWAPTVGDGAAANVAAGCVTAQRATVTVGTSAALRVARYAPVGTALPPLSDRHWRYRVDHDYIVTGTAYSSGGNLYAWAQRELRLPTGEALEEELARTSPQSPVADPRFGGDRPPGLAPAGSGSLTGLGFHTTAVDIFAALARGLCRQVAEDLVPLEEGLSAPMEVVLNGGAIAASLWWRSAFADALAPRSVHFQPEPEIGVVGAALVALGRIACPAPAASTGTDRDLRVVGHDSVGVSQYPS